MRLKIFTVITGMLIFAGSIEAGMFLDLDIGAHLDVHPDKSKDGTPWLGKENPLGVMRVGYQTEKYNISGPIDISAHGYYEHMSSMSNGNDTGVDVIMFGVRVE